MENKESKETLSSDILEENILKKFEADYANAFFEEGQLHEYNGVTKTKKGIFMKDDPVVRYVFWQEFCKNYKDSLEKFCLKNLISIELLNKLLTTPECLDEEESALFVKRGLSLIDDLKSLEVKFSSGENNVLSVIWDELLGSIQIHSTQDYSLSDNKIDDLDDSERLVGEALNKFIGEIKLLSSPAEWGHIRKSYDELVSTIKKNDEFNALFDHDMQSAGLGIAMADLFNYLDVEKWERQMDEYKNGDEEEYDRFRMMITSFNHVVLIVRSFFDKSKNNNLSSIRNLQQHLVGMKDFFKGTNKEVEIHILKEDSEGEPIKMDRIYSDTTFNDMRFKISFPHLYRLIYGFLTNAFGEGKGNADNVEIKIILKELKAKPRMEIDFDLILEIKQDGKNVRAIPEKLLDFVENRRGEKVQALFKKGTTVSTDDSGQGLGMNGHLLKQLGGTENVEFFNYTKNNGEKAGGIKIELLGQGLLRNNREIKRYPQKVKKVLLEVV